MSSFEVHSESGSSREDKLLIDPSLVVAARTYSQIREELMNSNLGEVFLPQSFLNGLREGNEELFSFYLSNAEPVSMRTLRNDLLESKRIQGYEAYISPGERFLAIRSHLLEEFGETPVLDSLWEEWIFLQEQSWIASRSKKVFRRFIKSGAVALETSKNVFDAFAGKTLKLPKKDIPRGLTSSQRLRATAKWVAVGGSSVTAFFVPTVGFLGNLVAGSFLLMDP